MSTTTTAPATSSRPRLRTRPPGTPRLTASPSRGRLVRQPPRLPRRSQRSTGDMAFKRLAPCTCDHVPHMAECERGKQQEEAEKRIKERLDKMATLNDLFG